MSAKANKESKELTSEKAIKFLTEKEKRNKENFLVELQKLQKQFGYEKLSISFSDQELSKKLIAVIKSQNMMVDFRR